MYFLDKYGWPVERIKGCPVLNFIRLLIHTRRISRRCQNIEAYNNNRVYCDDVDAMDYSEAACFHEERSDVD